MHDTRTRGGHWLAIPGFFCLLTVAGVLLTACAGPTPVPLSPSFESKDAAVQAFLDALAARDAATLERLAVNETEFLKHIWPALPASRPEVGMPGERAWQDQHLKNVGFLANVLSEHGGQRYELVAASFGAAPTTYGTFTVHPKTRLDVRLNGQVTEVRLFGSMIESGGRWKIYSFIVD
ncbi:MAG: hypothetical protein AMXMBFR57_26840 [Acidimicrobiia bacterium]